MNEPRLRQAPTEPVMAIATDRDAMAIAVCLGPTDTAPACFVMDVHLRRADLILERLATIGWRVERVR